MNTVITTIQLSNLIANPNCPIIVDVRIDDDFNADPQLIPGSLRCPFNKIIEFTKQYTHKEFVIYCQKGLKISQGAAAMLCNKGIKAKYLEGGQFAWRDANLPMINADKIQYQTKTNQTFWVTSQRPKIDALACIWLIRRFIDSNANILFVEQTQVNNVADRFSAVPFSVNTDNSKNNLCSYDLIIQEYFTKNNELLTMANAVRGASLKNNIASLEAPGLHAILFGLLEIHSNDYDLFNAGIAVYDSYYHWIKNHS